MLDFITARAMISRYVLSSCVCLSQVGYHNILKNVAIFSIHENTLTSKRRSFFWMLVPATWNAIANMFQYCFRSTDCIQIRPLTVHHRHLDLLISCCEITYKYMLSLGAENWTICSCRWWCLSVFFVNVLSKKAEHIITQVNLHASHKPRTGRIKLW